MASSNPRLFRLFAIALRIQDSTKRTEYLDEACAGDPDLRRRVEAMLNQGRHPEGLAPKIDEKQTSEPNRPKINSELVERSPGTANLDLTVGSVLAEKYLIEELLGEGAMGRVYRAKQVAPVRREVAVKVIKAEMDSKGGLSRFAIESQSLAMMDHPNIAQVFDAGTTESGRPFFVMELVRGLPITRYCDEQRLSLRRRLRLFVSVCEAIQHAHQKGIIHRDIKPSNVLVENFDGRPITKVIDFGLAKVSTEASFEGSSESSLGMILGTPEYMSPEQVDYRSRTIDTRSDVYSLGTLLFELVTGTPPIERHHFPEATMVDLLRMVREDAVLSASQRLKTCLTGVTVAELRQTKLRKLIRKVRGELDAIIAKALCKSIDGRYESAIGLARDIECYLRDEIVSAIVPTPVYRLSKIVRRNLFSVVCVCLILLTVFGGLAVTMFGLIRKNELAESERLAKTEAKLAHLKTLAALNGEKEASEKLRDRLIQINKRNEILSSIFTDLDRGRLRSGKESLKAVLSKRLLEAAASLEGEEIGDPSTVAEMRYDLGVSLRKCGYARQAIPLLSKALYTRLMESGPVHSETLSATEQLSYAYRDAGEFDRALDLLKETLRKRNASLGENHADTLRTAAELAECLRLSGK